MPEILGFNLIHRTILIQQNALMNKTTFKSDSYFVIIENNNLNDDSIPGIKNIENFDQTPPYIDRNTPN